MTSILRSSWRSVTLQEHWLRPWPQLHDKHERCGPGAPGRLCAAARSWWSEWGLALVCGYTTQIRSEAPITGIADDEAYACLVSAWVRQVLLASRYGPLASVVLEISRDAGDSCRCRGPRPTAVHAFCRVVGMDASCITGCRTQLGL